MPPMETTFANTEAKHGDPPRSSHRSSLFYAASGLAGGAGSPPVGSQPPPKIYWRVFSAGNEPMVSWLLFFLLACCYEPRHGTALTPLQLCAEAGVPEQPSPWRGYPQQQLPALFRKAAGGQSHSSALGWLGRWQREAVESLISSISPPGKRSRPPFAL